MTVKFFIFNTDHSFFDFFRYLITGQIAYILGATKRHDSRSIHIINLTGLLRTESVLRRLFYKPDCLFMHGTDLTGIPAKIVIRQPADYQKYQNYLQLYKKPETTVFLFPFFLIFMGHGIPPYCSILHCSIKRYKATVPFVFLKIRPL